MKKTRINGCLRALVVGVGLCAVMGFSAFADESAMSAGLESTKQTSAVREDVTEVTKGGARLSLENETQARERITLDQAKKIALKDAGIPASSATFIKARLDRDDGRLEYEIEFVAGGNKYEYDIDAYSGRIRKSEVESVEDDD